MMILERDGTITESQQEPVSRGQATLPVTLEELITAQVEHHLRDVDTMLADLETRINRRAYRWPRTAN